MILEADGKQNVVLNKREMTFRKSTRVQVNTTIKLMFSLSKLQYFMFRLIDHLYNRNIIRKVKQRMNEWLKGA